LFVIKQASSQGVRVETVERPPFLALKGHFPADCLSAKILNIVRLWNRINKIK